MLESILRGAREFFEANSVDTIAHRFINDMAYMDSLLSTLCMLVIPGIVKVLAVLIAVGVVNPWLFIPILIAVLPIAFLIRYSFSA